MDVLAVGSKMENWTRMSTVVSKLTAPASTGRSSTSIGNHWVHTCNSQHTITSIGHNGKKKWKSSFNVSTWFSRCNEIESHRHFFWWTSKPKTTSDFNAMIFWRGKQASIWNLSKHPNQKQRAISTRWIYCGESNRNIQSKNNKWFQRDEFIEGKANANLKSLETFKNQKQQANSTRANHHLD